MNTWIVGNHPIGHYISGDFLQPYHAKVKPNRLVSTSSEFEQEEYREKIFFMKGRIMAGQADLTKNEYGDKDFQWLLKEEIEERVGRNYWKDVRDMLTER
jgi:large subunit ribosomal protein L46